MFILVVLVLLLLNCELKSLVKLEHGSNITFKAVGLLVGANKVIIHRQRI